MSPARNDHHPSPRELRFLDGGVADAGRLVRPDLKVLFVTGYAANAAVGAGQLGDGMEVLTKPFNMLELERRVADMLAR